MRLLPFLLAFLLLRCTPAPAQGQRRNALEQQEKPYVILISLDGYRWDYTRRFAPPAISRLADEGTQAVSLIPSYPSKTFPNHYTIATGLYPERHGLVNNRFYDPGRGVVYRTSDRDLVQDGSWYGGLPLWVLAEQHGMVSASFFFVGSEADVQGVRPTYWHHYDGGVANRTRVDQALEWLRLPADRRPHLITLYFSDMDDTGHAFGPNNDEMLREALIQLDAELQRLFDGVRQLDLPIHIVLVSDHGMAEVHADQLLPVEALENEDRYRLVSNGALLHLYLHNPDDRETVYRELQQQEAAARWSVYRVEDFPYYRTPPAGGRAGDLLVLPDFPYYFVEARTIGVLRNLGGRVQGEHGFLPDIPDMHGIFYAWGPSIRRGLTLPSVRNVHIYPLICRILDLPPPEGIDGREEVLQGILR